VSTTTKTPTVVLIGNPNTGKSTLFNALAGLRQRVGNFPGVTVEKKLGRMSHEGQTLSLVDLPGTYSLAPRSPDEMVAVDVLLGRRDDVPPPDVVVCIVDASNLERNLYLVSQVLELGLPTVIALNMVDVAGSHGVVVDVQRLSRQLGAPVVPLVASRRRGVAELKAAVAAAIDTRVAPPPSPFPVEFRREVDQLEAALAARRQNGGALPRYLVERLLLDTGGYLEDLVLANGAGDLSARLHDARGRLEQAGCAVPAVEAVSRYGWVSQVVDGTIRRTADRSATFSDRLDRVLTHWFSGTLAFAVMMLAVFSLIFWAADWPMTWIDEGVGALGGWVEGALPAGALRSLLVDGVIAGVGAVVIFLPQILILFCFIAILEDCGYMARAAFLMDRLMSRVGLSGKSFIPLLSSFACAVPGIMATRVIENRRDRLTTILVAPLMSCSARLPVYVILIAAFIPDRSYFFGLLGLRGLTMFAMYLLGVVTAVLVALVLKKTLLRGGTPPFVMELPGYKWPSIRMVLHRMLDRGWAFLRRAGTLIFAVSIVVWAAAYYPRNEAAVEAPFIAQRERLESRLDDSDVSPSQREAYEAELADVENRIASEYQKQSFLGRAGRSIEPAVRPLGWDWRIGCAAIASFPAREVVMSVLGVIYNLGEVDVGDEQGQGNLRERLKAATWDDTGRPVYNIPVALSIMVFFALCAQCAATLAVIKRETNSWAWPVFTFTYMTGLAYLGALVTYQVGMRLMG